MNRAPGNFRWWMSAMFVVGFIARPLVVAEPAPLMTAPVALANPGQPALPVTKSPVESFRELIAMPPEERKQALATRPPEIRQRIAEKLQEYQILPPNEREFRLRATELRWYLLPLMSLPATNRAAQLAAIPADIRPLVEDRLRRWAILPVPVQKTLLENERAVRYLTQPGFDTPEQREIILAALSPERRAQLEAGIARLQQLPEDQRRKLFDHFNHYFDLTADEREKTLRALSEAERRQMEKTLADYGRLSHEQRSQCLRAFAQFASLSLAERQQFLQNAERWALMSPDERQSWRELVSRIPDWPPMPPTVIVPPPMPPGITPRVVPVTNGN